MVYQWVLFFFPLTYTLDLLAAALHVHKCTKAHLDFDPQLLSVIVYVSIKSLFTIETIQLKSVKVLKSWKIPTVKFCLYRGLNLNICNSRLKALFLCLRHVELSRCQVFLRRVKWCRSQKKTKTEFEFDPLTRVRMISRVSNSSFKLNCSLN